MRNTRLDALRIKACENRYKELSELYVGQKYKSRLTGAIKLDGVKYLFKGDKICAVEGNYEYGMEKGYTYTVKELDISGERFRDDKGEYTEVNVSIITVRDDRPDDLYELTARQILSLWGDVLDLTGWLQVLTPVAVIPAGEDAGFCRKYYRSIKSGVLYALQEDSPGKETLYRCSESGGYREPEYPVTTGYLVIKRVVD